jgi:hypothetical protein
MNRPVLRIGATEHEIQEVRLSAHHHEQEGEHFLTVDLFADSKDLARAGFAINSVTLRGLQRPKDLEGKVLALARDGDDELNELAESVICEPGRVLEIDWMRLEFGRMRTGRLPVKMEAECHVSGTAGIPVLATFEAALKE